MPREPLCPALISPWSESGDLGGAYNQWLELLGNRYRFVTFVDGGNVWNDVSDFSWDGDWKAAAGVGLVLGPHYFPISLYWAWVIDKAPGDREERFSFNMATMF